MPVEMQALDVKSLVRECELKIDEILSELQERTGMISDIEVIHTRSQIGVHQRAVIKLQAP